MPKPYGKSVSFAPFYASVNLDLSKIGFDGQFGSEVFLLETCIKSKMKRLNFFFGNITKWGPQAQSEFFSEECKLRYQVCGLVETHNNDGANADMRARASSQGFDAQLNHAMKHPDSAGNHGGEAMLTSKSTFSLPIDPTVLQNASDINDEPCRFAAVEVRFGQMSILNISAYFWCGEGLGGEVGPSYNSCPP